MVEWSVVGFLWCLLKRVVCVYMVANMEAWMYAHIHAHMHTCTHALTQTHTYGSVLLSGRSPYGSVQLSRL